MVRLLAALAAIVLMCTFAHAQTKTKREALLEDLRRHSPDEEVGAFFCMQPDGYRYVRPNLEGSRANADACMAQFAVRNRGMGGPWLSDGCFAAVTCKVGHTREFVDYIRADTQDEADARALARAPETLEIYSRKGSDCRVKVRWCPNKQNVPVEVPD